MSLFRKIFGNKNPPTTTKFEMISDAGDGFYSWDGKIYKSDIIRSCVRPKAQAIGKLVAKHIRDLNGDFKVNPDASIRFLLEEPNPYMSGQVFQEKMATQLMLNGNAFAYIKKDEYGYPYEIYPVPCTFVELHKNDLGDLFLRFNFENGSRMTVPYVDVIHLRRDFNNDDFFGESPASSITTLMTVVTTVDQGVVKAVKNSNTIKWLLKFKQVLRPEDIKSETQKFVDNYLSINNEVGGAAATDPKYDAEQVKPESYVPNAAQMKETVQRIYSFFNTNEKIVQSKYTEDEWNAYFEAEIEPLAMQMSMEYTRKIFTRKERGFGNRIIFEASSLQYASMSTKLNLVQMVDRGSLTPNEWRNVMNLGPIEGGDKPLRRLDTAIVEGGDNDEDGTEGTS